MLSIMKLIQHFFIAFLIIFIIHFIIELLYLGDFMKAGSESIGDAFYIAIGAIISTYIMSKRTSK